MGLQILPADIPPPAIIRRDSAPQLPAKDDTSRFDGYLNDARSAVDTEPGAQYLPPIGRVLEQLHDRDAARAEDPGAGT